MADHVHALIALPSTLSVTKGAQLLKGGSSLRVHQAFARCVFAWQAGCGAFSVSEPQLEKTIVCIKGQATPHRRRSSREEFVAFLEKHNARYEERFLWG